MKKLNKIDSVCWDIYRELYKHSTPAADFDKLVEEASINERVQKVIDFMAYEISVDEMDAIIESELNKHKFTKLDRQIVRNTIYFGCSPKSNYA